jgi:hypothetical protein
VRAGEKGPCLDKGGGERVPNERDKFVCTRAAPMLSSPHYAPLAPLCLPFLHRYGTPGLSVGCGPAVTADGPCGVDWLKVLGTAVGRYVSFAAGVQECMHINHPYQSCTTHVDNLGDVLRFPRQLHGVAGAVPRQDRVL